MLCKNTLKTALLTSVLCGITLTAPPSFAQMNSNKSNSQNFETNLNKRNIEVFLATINDIATGKNAQMSDQDVVNFFQNHVAEDGVFESTMRYEIPGFPTQDILMILDKESYISSVVKGRYTMRDYNTEITISDLKVKRGKKWAEFTSKSEEKGKIPFPKDPKRPDDVELIHVTGTSECSQSMRISDNNFIQMVKADCNTVVSFDPFGGKPLIPR
jgi:hypothetical protein